MHRPQPRWQGRASRRVTHAARTQVTSEFIEDMDKIRVNMHMHSFTYDYHLRTIHSYVSGQQLLFKHGYHLTSFLDDFVKYYQKSPNYARNLIHAGESGVPSRFRRTGTVTVPKVRLRLVRVVPRTHTTSIKCHVVAFRNPSVVTAAVGAADARSAARRTQTRQSRQASEPGVGTPRPRRHPHSCMLLFPKRPHSTTNTGIPTSDSVTLQLS